MFRTSIPVFGLFEASELKSRERTGFEVSETGLLKKPDFVETLVLWQLERQLSAKFKQRV